MLEYNFLLSYEVRYLKWRTTILASEVRSLELAFQDSDIKSLALKMTFKKREPDVWSRRKAYRPIN